MTHTYAAYKIHLRTKDLHRLKAKHWKQIFQANGQGKKAGVAVLMSDKIDFKKAMKRDTEGHLIILKGRIHQENINIINIYAPNIGAPKYMRKIFQEFKKVIDSNTLILRDFNSPLSKMNSSSKQNINMDTVALNNSLHQMHLYISVYIYIYTLYIYIFSS